MLVTGPSRRRQPSLKMGFFSFLFWLLLFCHMHSTVLITSLFFWGGTVMATLVPEVSFPVKRQDKREKEAERENLWLQAM